VKRTGQAYPFTWRIPLKKFLSFKQLLILIFLSLILPSGGCNAKRDESTGQVRKIVSSYLHVDLSKVKADSTLSSLGCTKSQFLGLVKEIESSFSITLSPKDNPRLRADDDSWKSIQIIDLADMVRPEWSKSAQGK
jgi:hypothetical protein